MPLPKSRAWQTPESRGPARIPPWRNNLGYRGPQGSPGTWGAGQWLGARLAHAQKWPAVGGGPNRRGGTFLAGKCADGSVPERGGTVLAGSLRGLVCGPEGAGPRDTAKGVPESSPKKAASRQMCRGSSRSGFSPALRTPSLIKGFR